MLFSPEPLGPETKKIQLSAEESRHLIKVLRRQAGDKIRLTDGRGGLATGRISKADSRACEAEIVHFERREKPSSHRIILALAPTKNADRTEWFVEKCTEIGCDEFVFIRSEHSERRHFKTDRIAKKSVSALKQSARIFLPQISELTDFEEFVTNCLSEQKFIARIDFSNPLHLFDAAKAGRSVCILIGPEGDFSENEIALARSAGFVPVNLGETVLRTETAGVAACLTLNLLNRKK